MECLVPLFVACSVSHGPRNGVYRKHLRRLSSGQRRIAFFHPRNQNPDSSPCAEGPPSHRQRHRPPAVCAVCSLSAVRANSRRALFPLASASEGAATPATCPITTRTQVCQRLIDSRRVRAAQAHNWPLVRRRTVTQRARERESRSASARYVRGRACCRRTLM